MEDKDAELPFFRRTKLFCFRELTGKVPGSGGSLLVMGAIWWHPQLPFTIW